LFVEGDKKMGSSLGIKCRECNYSITLMLGIGMMYSPYSFIDFDSGYNMFSSVIKSKTMLNRVKSLILDEGGILLDGYQHDAYYCPKCSFITERFSFQIDYSGCIYKPSYRCNRCKSKLENMSLDNNECYEALALSEYACPDCGKYSLEEDITTMIMWD
jgi:DNA-directed RNA polymerase subunit RPC12/RpoP